MNPLYTADNCRAAYELRWSLALFANRQIPAADTWSDHLAIAVEPDGVRILEQTLRSPTTVLFLLSTKPHVSPKKIVKSVKGRLQHAVRASHGELFKRNFSLTSIGDVRRDAVERYVSDQLGHHRMADKRVQERLEDFQLAFPDVNLGEARFHTHGRYLCNLHLVLVHDQRWCEVGLDRLAITRNMVIRAARKKEHLLSRLSVLPDHLHATLGISWNESPADVALCYMNNLAYAHAMKPVLQFGYFVGTFGEYDLGAVRQRLQESSLHAASRCSVTTPPARAGGE